MGHADDRTDWQIDWRTERPTFRKRSACGVCDGIHEVDGSFDMITHLLASVPQPTDKGRAIHVHNRQQTRQSYRASYTQKSQDHNLNSLNAGLLADLVFGVDFV